MDHSLALRQQLKETDHRSSSVNNQETNNSSSSSSSWFDKSAVLLKEEPDRKSRKDVTSNKLLSLSAARSKETTRNKVQWLRETRDYSFLSSDSTHEIIINPGPGNIKSGNSRPPEITKEIKGSKIQGPNKVIIINRDSTKQDNCSCRNIISKKTLETKKKRKPEQEKEDIKAISIIRRMSGYDPSKFSDDNEDDDVRIMEANFHDIEKEERLSTKIARKEDAEELRKLSVPNSKKLKQMT